MASNPLLRLQDFGQSIWLDFMRRSLITSGQLRRLIVNDGLRGVTSNPAIFEKAIAGSRDYDETIRALALEGKRPDEIYQALVVDDIQRAADCFRSLYDELDGHDGFVSLEVSPRLAHDTDGTLADARRLWAAVNRPNIMIKVPATREGLPAIRQLTREGLNINVTLLFDLTRYQEVAEAYIAGLEDRARRGEPLDQITSVASFFLSRIDALIDPLLEKFQHADDPRSELAASLHGAVAIASARAAYQIYRKLFSSARFLALARRGAQTQRLLWASTSTKNPAYSDVKYVEALIGPMTVNTLPLETLEAYRHHGDPAPRLDERVAEARQLLQHLPELGIDLTKLTQQLEDEGVRKFSASFDLLMNSLAGKRTATLAEPVDRQVLDAAHYATVIAQRLIDLERKRFVQRVWEKDPRPWNVATREKQTLRQALGWLHVAEKIEENLPQLADFAAEIRAAGFRRAVLLGIGGNGLASLVFQRTFEPTPQGLPLTILDTTDPATILEIERELPLTETLFIVASKSGTTAEPLALCDYVYARMEAYKANRAGENFVAITDPGTPLAALAHERGFRRTFLNFSDMGERYSVLSYSGLVPAALLGIDVAELLVRALRMVHASAACVPVYENPGVVLGAILGELACQERDKVTLVLPEPIAALGMWLEQLLAESTGKHGAGLLPIAGEPLGAPEVYGNDRLFVQFQLTGASDQIAEQRLDALRRAGHPIVTIQLDDRLDLGQEFFRWEMATATAGAILGVNPFDQPAVQETKDNTNRLLDKVKNDRWLLTQRPALVEGTLQLYAPAPADSVAETLRQFFLQVHASDYVAIMAYLTETEATDRQLQALRVWLRDQLHVATTVGYGPRFLYSTGQYHKGGPNTGLFVQLTADNVEDVQIPGRSYTFGAFREAQALGDGEALRRQGRRVLRIHLGRRVDEGLAQLEQTLHTALQGHSEQTAQPGLAQHSAYRL